MRSRWSSLCSGRGGVVIGLRSAGSAKGNVWLDGALENRTIAGLTPVGGCVRNAEALSDLRFVSFDCFPQSFERVKRPFINGEAKAQIERQEQ